MNFDPKNFLLKIEFLHQSNLSSTYFDIFASFNQHLLTCKQTKFGDYICGEIETSSSGALAMNTLGTFKNPEEPYI